MRRRRWIGLAAFVAVLLASAGLITVGTQPADASAVAAGITSYGGPAHTFDVADGPNGALVQTWTHDLGGAVDSPLIVGSAVVATASWKNSSGLAREDVEAFDAATGAALWPPIAVGTSGAALASDGERVYVSSNGQVMAIDLATGQQDWATYLPSSGATPGNSVILSNGEVWVEGQPFTALDPATGAIVSTISAARPSGELAAVNGILYSLNCALDLSTGTPVWEATGISGCSMESRISQVDGNVLLTPSQFSSGQSVVNALTGAPLYTLPDGQSALGEGQVSVASNDDKLTSYVETTGAQRWAITLPAFPLGPPLLSTTGVTVETVDGHLRQYSLAAGTLISDTVLPTTPVFQDLTIKSVPMAGSGVIAVPSGDSLTLYRGANGSLPPQLSAAPTPTRTVASSTTGADTSAGDQYGEDQGHDGVAQGSKLTAPLRAVWSKSLPGTTSNAIVDEFGRLFVAAHDPRGGMNVYRLNPQTGAVDWGPKYLPNTLTEPADVPTLAESDGILLAYDTGQGLAEKLYGLDPASGTRQWITQLPYLSYGYTGYASVNSDTAYILGVDGDAGGICFAIDLTTGHVDWTCNAVADEGQVASPIGSSLVYYSGGGDQLTAYNTATGARAFVSSSYYTGGPGSAVLAGGLLYLNDYVGGGKVVDPATGDAVSRVFVTRHPAIDTANNMIVALQGDRLTAEDLGDRTRLWSFTGAGTLSVSPTIANGIVYTADADGTLWALDEGTGQPDWQDNHAFAAATPQASTTEVASLTVGAAGLALTSGNTIRMYVGTVDNGPTDPPVPTPPTPPTPPSSPTPQSLIAAHYSALGGRNSVLGAPVGSTYAIHAGVGQNYQNGQILWSASTGTKMVAGAVDVRYKALEGPNGSLGFPKTDQGYTRDRVGQWIQFAGGFIYWTPTTGARVLSGAIDVKWAALGSEHGHLGYPTSDVFAIAGGQRVNFQHGLITYNSKTNGIGVFYS